jgi:uncharacterized membrane protein YidH (DUF202 family)
VQQEPPIVTDNILVNEVQLLLAEKRTALATLRAGTAVLVLPLSVGSILITTSRHYNATHVANLLIPLLVVAVALVGLGTYLIIHSILRIRRYDRLIHKIKQEHSAFAEFIE